jgi:putative inorganic carbon (HCO3(-)) transporter
MILIFLAAIFIRPFISSLAFPFLNFFYSLGLLAILSGLIIYKKVSFPKIHFLLPPIFLFILVLLISLFSQGSKINSLAQFCQYLGAILLFLVVASFSSQNKLLVVRTIMFSALGVSLLAIYQYFIGFSHLASYLSVNQFSFPFALDYLKSRRVFVPFVTPNILGGYLAMVIPLFLINKDRFWLVLPVIFALLLTMSVGAIFSLFCVLAIFYCVKKENRKKYIFSLAGLFILIMVIFIWRTCGPREHVHPAFSTLMRLNYWQETLEIIKAHPLLGIGLGNFNLTMSRYAHNAYLQIWAEIGPLGLFSFLWIVVTVFKSRLKDAPGLFNHRQAFCLLAASTVFLIHNFLDFSFFLPEVAFIWWVILGLIVI